MLKLLSILLILSAVLPCSADAKTKTLERIATAAMKASDFRHQGQDCTSGSNGAICASVLYRYEIDEQGHLYFAAITTYNAMDPGSASPEASPVSTLICQLDSMLNCALPGLNDQQLDLSAYAVSEEGVLVHGKINPWADPQRAAMLLPHIIENIESAAKTQVRMMDNLSCYMFDFGALVREFKTYGRLIDDDSKKLLKADACMASFKEICSDRGSRQDELNLASSSVADAKTSKKFAINVRDIDQFCNSIKTTKSAMLR